MSLRPQALYLVPEETARVAQAAFPKGTLYMRMYDTLGTIFADYQFADLFPRRGQSAQAPVRLALATILQFAEGLSDRQAADAVRSRIDWKYLLCLKLTDSGFDHTVLSEFRSRLIAGDAEHILLDILLSTFRDHDLLKSRGRQRPDSTHILAAIRTLNRLERVGETMRAALNALAVVAPDWLQSWVPAEWYERYGARIDNYQLPKVEAERAALATTIGVDGFHLLEMINSTAEVSWLCEVPAVKTLRQVWHQHYTEPPGPVCWRAVKDLPPTADQIASPYDPEARWSTKRSVNWVGYKVHVTETCDPDLPHIITHVETTPATTPDLVMIPSIHAALAKQELLPAEHFVDTGYVVSKDIVFSRDTQGVALIGPFHPDSTWQAKANEGFDTSAFTIDWNAKKALCPQGKTNKKWKAEIRGGYPVIKIRFGPEDCRACPVRPQCTKAPVDPREITVREEAEYTAIQNLRSYQKTVAFKEAYAVRAGVEGTLSQGIQRCNLRQSRYVGLAKTHLQHVITAAALNLVRIGEWFAETPFAKTRRSSFVRLNTIAA